MRGGDQANSDNLAQNGVIEPGHSYWYAIREKTVVTGQWAVVRKDEYFARSAARIGRKSKATKWTVVSDPVASGQEGRRGAGSARVALSSRTGRILAG